MTRLPLAALCIVTAGPALAYDPCDDLWFSRNQLFDRAGYCFSTPLGQAVFDNSDCVGKDVTLEPGGYELVDLIKTNEEIFECAVDTTRSALDIDNLALRTRLESVVFRSEFASGCLGWQGDALPLLAGPRDEAEVISVAMPGYDLVWEYEGFDWPEGWSFLTVYDDDSQIALGFFFGEIDYELCSGLAG